ncbi:MAG: polyprenyl synthetase family protein, partial [Nitrospirae bacterium]|nr:polyprenyl synthetase family protein [Nitrospirota bacterium]
MDIKAYFNKKNRLIDGFIETHFNERLAPSIFKDSIVYSLSAGGKRLRPILCLAAYEACGGSGDEIVPYASALEFIHTYSLIHDDLPAMDNDDVRRGKPTNHKVFGEGMAILAGDALLTEAFYLISGEESRISANHLPHAVLLRVIHELSRASGMHGMVKGQAQDLLSENSEPDAAILESIHLHKTAALITASVRIGGILAGCSEEALIRLTQYGKNIGLAFQVVDDILDVEGETETIGKPRGSDDKKKKMTY